MIQGESKKKLNIIKLDVTPEQLTRARELYEFHNIKNSVTKGKSEIYGAIGEIVVMDYFGDRVNSKKSTRNNDMEIDNRKVEVKSKRTTAYVLPHYLCSVFASSTHQQCQVYFFTRVTEDLKTAYLIGWLPRREFYDNATFYKKGEIDPESSKNRIHRFTDDCWNIKAIELNPFKTIKE